MPQAKKSTPKKSNVARSNKANNTYAFKPWHAIAGLALFIAGGFVVAYSQASSDVAATKAQLPLVQYEEGSSGTIVEKEGPNSKLVQGPKTIQLTQTGELFCFGENQDQGATRKLTKPEVTQVLNDISSSGLVQLPTPPEDQVQVDTKLIRYIDPKTGAIVGINLSNVTSDNTSYKKAVSTLQAACAKNAQPTKRQNAPEIRVKTSTPTTMHFPAIRRAIIGTAQAGATPDPKVAWLNRYNEVMRWNIQNARRENGLPYYIEEPCLGVSSSKWSSTMATNYNNNTAAKEAQSLPVIYHSKIEQAIPADCGSNWITIGENVGTAGAMQGGSADVMAKQLFDSYMASPGHRANILNARFNRFNTATIISANGYRVFNTQHFMLR